MTEISLVEKHSTRKVSKPQWKPIADPGIWKDSRQEFEGLAAEESRTDPGSKDNRDRLLRAYGGPEDDWNKEDLECGTQVPIRVPQCLFLARRAPP